MGTLTEAVLLRMAVVDFMRSLDPLLLAALIDGEA